MDIAGMRKALVGAFLPLIYAVAQQVTGIGDGPSADQVAAAGDATATVVKLLVEMGVGGFLVWLIPNRTSA
jgi:uncharacterized membrane protein